MHNNHQKYAAKVILEAATKAGAPKDCIQWIEVPSIEATKQLMNHKDIALVLARLEALEW